MAVLQSVPVNSNHHSPWITPPETQREFWISSPCHRIRRIVERGPLCRQFAAKPPAPFIATLPSARLQFFQPASACTCVEHFGFIELKNFRGNQGELDEALEFFNHSSFYSQLASAGVKWWFNPPKLPRSYESMERLVGSSIGALKHIPCQQSFTDQTLSVPLKEPEHLSIHRPLTYVTVEPSASEPLTTYHLSPDRDNPAVIQPDIAMSSHLSFQKRCRIIESIAEFFGWRQMTECVPAPKERRKWFKKVKLLIVKEVVLSIINHTPRSQWSFGPATKLFLDLDGVMRPASALQSHRDLSSRRQALPVGAGSRKKKIRPLPDAGPAMFRIGARRGFPSRNNNSPLRRVVVGEADSHVRVAESCGQVAVRVVAQQRSRSQSVIVELKSVYCMCKGKLGRECQQVAMAVNLVPPFVSLNISVS